MPATSVHCVSPQDPQGSRMMEWRHVEPVCCGNSPPIFSPSSFWVWGCTSRGQVRESFRETECGLSGTLTYVPLCPGSSGAHLPVQGTFLEHRGLIGQHPNLPPTEGLPHHHPPPSSQPALTQHPPSSHPAPTQLPPRTLPAPAVSSPGRSRRLCLAEKLAFFPFLCDTGLSLLALTLREVEPRERGGDRWHGGGG